MNAPPQWNRRCTVCGRRPAFAVIPGEEPIREQDILIARGKPSRFLCFGCWRVAYVLGEALEPLRK